MNSEHEHPFHEDDGVTERVPVVWGKIPPRHMNFTGRDRQLAELHRRLHVGDGSRRSVPYMLQGYQGVGKTLMAVEYVHRYKHDYDLVWWIPAGRTDQVRNELAQLAPHLDLADPEDIKVRQAVPQVLDRLYRGVPYQRWLLVFDNADRPEDLYGLIPQGPGHVLITSQNHRWSGRATSLRIDVLSAEESTSFLRKRAPDLLDRESAQELAEALGHLPLALEQAGAFIWETGMPPEEYCRLLDHQAGELLEYGRPPEYPQSLSRTLRTAFDRLDRQPETMELLRLCSFLGPEPIPRDIFSPKAIPRVRPETAALLNDPMKLSRAFARLGRYALTHIDNSRRTVQVHRLLQAFVRQTTDAERHETIRAEACALLAAAAPPDLLSPEARTRYLDLLPHLRPAGALKSDRPEVRELSLNVLSFLHLSGDDTSAEEYARELGDLWSTALGGDDPYVLRTRRRHADRLRDTGRHREARRLNQEILPRFREALGEDHPDTLSLRSGIGADLRFEGRFHEALAHDIETHRLHEERLGAEHEATLRALHHVAVDRALTSAFRQARKAHERVYMLYKRTAPAGGSPNLAAFWNCLAQDVRLDGAYGEACDLGAEVLAYGRARLGADHPRTLRAQLDLSVALRLHGDLEQARTHAEEVHDRLMSRYGPDHPETLASGIGLANLMRAEGDEAAALSVTEKVRSGYVRLHGADHPLVQGCSANTALLHRLLGDPGAALCINTAVLRSLDSSLGPEHHYSLGVATNLASDLAAQGRTGEAVRWGEKALVGFRRLLGAEHPAALCCSANLALDLVAEGRASEAREMGDRAYTLCAEALGPQHRVTQVILKGERTAWDFDPPSL